MTRRDEPPAFSWSLGDRDPAPAPASIPAPPATGPTDDTLTVPQVCARVKGMLARTFPEPFWLVGEASGLSRTQKSGSGHWYFTLVDDQCEDPRTRASLSVTLWRGTVARFFGPRGRLRTLVPEDGVVLRVLVKPDFYAPRGALNFIVEDIDPEFTLGNLDRRRRELLAKLDAEGVLLRNRRTRLPEVPLRVGLVTSLESAAYNDVLKTLTECGLGLTVLACDARMQGEETGRSVRAALVTLAALRPDAILLCRGGGSRLDLSWFDREDIARAIAACPVPVLTGIGHEIDTSIADAAAHSNFKTPTAAAQFLVDRVREGLRDVQDAMERLLVHAQDTLLAGDAEVRDAGARLRRAATVRVAGEALGLRASCAALRGATERAIATADGELRELRVRLGRGRHMERVAALGAQLQAQRERLFSQARALLDRQQALLDAAADRTRLLDPRQVLRRGFAWLRRQDGSLLMDAAAARTGENLTAVLRDGELDVRVRDAAARAAPRPDGV